MKLTKQQRNENQDCARRAKKIIDAYVAETGNDTHDDFNLCDLLTDLMHRSHIDVESEDFDDALAMARKHFNTEINGDD